MTSTVARQGRAGAGGIGAAPAEASGSRWALDPRTAVVLLLAASIAVTAPGGVRFVPAAVTAGVLLAISERAWTRAVGLPVAAGAAAAVAYLLPQVAAWPVLGLVGVVAAYGLRLLAVGGIAAHLIRTISPTRLTAALRSARVPRAFTVSGAVLLRFLPTIIAESRAVRDAMRLRGLGGWGKMLRHPVRSIEHFTVPLMASSLRAAEDLSASALLRGLGSPTPPTSMHPPRFGRADAMAAAVAVILAAATIWWGAGQ
ncbi:energy-coupling factor transporter transmembrane component T [Nocardia sp. NPDC049707]|uniref:energy-coupling factor transporter transmembrane component T n=1 Tax=Nocardia sp. NPDC049707 TaxID=3154735 RepID=UPI0034158F4B